MTDELRKWFGLEGRVAVVTGGLGLLGRQHSAAITAAGGIPVLVDIRTGTLEPQERQSLLGDHGSVLAADITDPEAVEGMLTQILDRYGRVDILVNNAANNPKMEPGQGQAWSRLENFSITQWEQDLAVGLKGAFLCSRVLGGEMARRGKGVIVNVASDLALIAPDQRLYRKEGLPEDGQPVKPVTYSVVKAGLIGLTKYLATYWADRGVRVNALSPGGIYAGQPDEFVERLSRLIPMGRMAGADEYQGALLFLCSDASSYMTGSNLVVEGGRTCW